MSNLYQDQSRLLGNLSSLFICTFLLRNAKLFTFFSEISVRHLDFFHFPFFLFVFYFLRVVFLYFEVFVFVVVLQVLPRMEKIRRNSTSQTKI